MKVYHLIGFVLLISFDSFSQQQYFMSIGEVIPDSVCVKDYFDGKWQDEKRLLVREKKTIEIKGRKERLKSIEHFNDSLGFIAGTYFMYKKKKLYHSIEYLYDSIKRLNKINYKGISGSQTTIEFSYNENNQIAKCIEHGRNMSFGYNNDGSKNWIAYNKGEIEEHYKLNYYYDDHGRMLGLVSTPDTLPLYYYLNDTIVYNGYNNWETVYVYSNGLLIESFDKTYTNFNENESVKYEYIPNSNKIKLVTVVTELKPNKLNKYYLEYTYYENGLLKRKREFDNKGKTRSILRYEYEYY